MLVGIGVIVGTNNTKLQLTVKQNITPAAKQNSTDRKANVLWITPLSTLDPLSTIGNLCLSQLYRSSRVINRNHGHNNELTISSTRALRVCITKEWAVYSDHEDDAMSGDQQ